MHPTTNTSMYGTPVGQIRKSNHHRSSRTHLSGYQHKCPKQYDQKPTNHSSWSHRSRSSKAQDQLQDRIKIGLPLQRHSHMYPQSTCPHLQPISPSCPHRPHRLRRSSNVDKLQSGSTRSSLLVWPSSPRCFIAKSTIPPISLRPFLCRPEGTTEPRRDDLFL